MSQDLDGTEHAPFRPLDTTRTPEWLRKKHRALSLTTTPIATHRTHFRLFTRGCLEEWREANGGFAGRSVLWTIELSTGDEALTHRVYQGVSPLDSTTVRFSPEIRGVTKRWSVSNIIIQYNPRPHQRAGITDVAHIQF